MFYLKVADALRTEGHNILRASDVGQARSDDEDILRKAISDNRILVTLDEHFGDWVVLPLSEHHGVIRLKVNPATSDRILKILVPFLKRHVQEDFKNHLVIISERMVKWIRTCIGTETA
jgi:predicted nuclease of predicted toxin-antitoxin system